MRIAVVSALVGICLLIAYPAFAAPRPSGNRTILPLASATPTLTVNANTHESAAPSKQVAATPAYGSGTATGVAVANGATYTTTTEYYEGEGCDADIFDPSGSSDDGTDDNGGDSTSKGDDDDDDKNKPTTEPTKSGDDDDNKSNDGADAGTDGTTKTLNVTAKLHPTAIATPAHHRSSSPVSRVAIAGAIILLPLRRRRKL